MLTIIKLWYIVSIDFDILSRTNMKGFQMLLKELAEILAAHAKQFRNGVLRKEIVPTLVGQGITTSITRQIIEPFLSSVDLPTDVREIMGRKMEKWLPDSLESISRNSHMNDAGGKTVVNQDTADALLVDFVNNACFPLDLAMYTSDLVE